ncbi:MAG: hypothetical protein CSA20_08500 [Deltaproteobacteria bacterium]|nr:MAG: hypothetical protein CSA20_08500 [Deltaproteobacteria bacterium]
MITLDDITLPGELVWVDELDWTPVAQAVSYTLAGSLMVESSAKLAGRPITLSRGDGDAWITRATLLLLMAMVEEPGRVMTLTLHDGREFSVMFRQGDKPLEAQQVAERSEPQSGHYYTCTLRLMEVAA